MNSFRDYHDAHRYALQQARQYNRPMALELANEYGRKVYQVTMLPIDESQRFGWEMHCEVVKPTD